MEESIRTNDVERIERLVQEEGPQVLEKSLDEFAQRPLHVAASLGHYDVRRLPPCEALLLALPM